MSVLARGVLRYNLDVKRRQADSFIEKLTFIDKQMPKNKIIYDLSDENRMSDFLWRSDGPNGMPCDVYTLLIDDDNLKALIKNDRAELRCAVSCDMELANKRSQDWEAWSSLARPDVIQVTCIHGPDPLPRIQDVLSMTAGRLRDAWWSHEETTAVREYLTNTEATTKMLTSGWHDPNAPNDQPWVSGHLCQHDGYIFTRAPHIRMELTAQPFPFPSMWPFISQNTPIYAIIYNMNDEKMQGEHP
ncbi:hypothetical protein FPQ18DRAFT_310014 [Pyronema domesticum]|nr:hypothetical protein FPQ18DRAFT_310014 [Pyronema domesticum]